MTTIVNNEDAIQYVLDVNGNKTAVLIPIELWNQWNSKKKPAEKTSSFSIKKYRGILKGKGIKGRDIQEKMRDEWD